MKPRQNFVSELLAGSVCSFSIYRSRVDYLRCDRDLKSIKFDMPYALHHPLLNQYL